MKRSSKPLIIFVLGFFIAATFSVLAYVSIKKKCEVFTKEKVLSQEKLNAKINQRTNLMAQNQMLTSEERIIGIAINELGMIKRTSAAIEVKVDKDKINRISKVIKEKYE